MTVKYHKRQMIQALRCAADACTYHSKTADVAVWGSAITAASIHFDMPSSLMITAAAQVGVDIVWSIYNADTKRQRLLEAAQRIEEGWKP